MSPSTAVNARQPITIRLLDMFSIGPGPSSSHTVGPMRAALRFRQSCLEQKVRPARIEIELRGSLSATGRGHGTDRAVLAGLCGWQPESCDCDALLVIDQSLQQEPRIDWGDTTIELRPDDVRFARIADLRDGDLPHPNTVQFTAVGHDGAVLLRETWCSVGGGFIQRADQLDQPFAKPHETPARHPFWDSTSLLRLAQAEDCGIGDVILRNEFAWANADGESEDAILRRIDVVYQEFQTCIARGLHRSGELPGGLGVQRRAPELFARVNEGRVEASYAAIARGQAYAYAINEENAAGGRVVTAPTNGAAGIFPAVLVEVAERRRLKRHDIRRAIATAGAIAMVIKTHASLSGAEVGCQGEVGSATAMAAAALCEVFGGTPAQVENAAEIGLEHNLGLTCDPIKGLVQAPCIERNAMGVAKAWSAAKLALHNSGSGVVSLDSVIRVMRRTGLDMRREYKETSEGGLAVAIPEC